MDATQQLIWEPDEQDEEQGGSDREPRGRLRIFAGSQRAETEFMVYSGMNVIGRHESCHICIPVQSVSKKHAVIEIEGDNHLIHDCKSLNSTRRKNAILKPFIRYQICDGDLFLFGDVACQYVMLPPAAQLLDSDSETDSESMLPQMRPCAGTDGWEELTDSDPAPEAASSSLESADDSLVLSPTQPYGHKLAMQVVQSDVYVKESEDDDTPWKEARSISSRMSQDPNISVHQTPSSHVVPESDDEAENTPHSNVQPSHSNVQPSQLHYDSDTDLDDDQRSGEERAEHSSKQPANEISPQSVAGQDSVPVTSDAMLNNLSATDDMAGNKPGKAVDRDAGVVSPQGLITSPSADIQPCLKPGKEDLKEDIVADDIFSRGSTKMDSSLLNGPDTREVANTSIAPEEQVDRHEADDSASNSPRAQEETKETLANVEVVDGVEADVDDDSSEFYALQPTQCFVLTVPSTQDETPEKENPVTDGANTEEEATQVYTCDCPSFNQEPQSDNPATAADNTEEEGTQVFTFQSPTFSKDHARSSITTASDHGKELSQEEGGRGAASGSEQVQEESDTVLLVTKAADAGASLQECPQEQERGGPKEEECWASEETQQFLTHERAVEEEKEQVEEPEETLTPLAEGLSTLCTGDRPTLGPADSPPRTGAEESLEPLAAEPAGSGKAEHSRREEGEPQISPEHGGQGEAAGGKSEESSQATPAAGQVSGRRSRAKPRATDCKVSGWHRKEQPIPSEQSSENNREASQEAMENGPQPSTEEAAATPRAEATTARPRRGRGRQKASSQSTTDQQLCPANGSPCSPPQRKGRRRSVAAPREVTQQTESPPELRHTARGKRTRSTQPSSQQTELPSGRLRRSRVANQINNEKETDTPPQTKTRRQTSQLSPSASVASVTENVALPKSTQPSSQQTELPSGRLRRSRAENQINSEKETDTPPQTKTRRQTSQLSPSASVASVTENVALPKSTQPSSQQTELPSGRLRRSRAANQINSEKETDTPPQTKTRRHTSQLSPSASVASVTENVALPKSTQPSSQQTELPSGHLRRSRAENQINSEKETDTPQQTKTRRQTSQLSPSASVASVTENVALPKSTQPSSQQTELPLGRLRRSRVANQIDSEKETSTPPQIKTRRQTSQLSPSASVASVTENVALPKVMFTGLVDEDGMKVITRLGGEVVECVHSSTHLVTDRIRRTVKFMCAVARGIPVVTPDWLKKSGMNSYFLSPRSFLLEDRDQEQNFNFKLKDSLQKAKEQPLLQEYQIHVTAGVQPNPSQMAAILQCSGATVLPKMPRAYKEKMLVISCPADLPKCRAARDAGIPIVNAEFILMGILQHTVDLAKYRLDEGDAVDSMPEERGRKRSSTVDSKPEERGSKPGPTTAAPAQPAAAKKRKKR
ncbi:mediator of DNA damage checkpoint protein 1 isoform X2 [Hypanus sabinus]|uniref:mediator of DNA damage checkpoint protein 1 isoform X2 n=1 Tax=Hypanus sabinus TaxID=79690 RepID=UPI0028C4C47B|nr:mediator of DNA damage checkpoint protein 1 isoform X2 [Hypanus sabinus]